MSYRSVLTGITISVMTTALTAQSRLYVDPARGNDTTGTPYKTIKVALQQAQVQGKQMVHLLPGIYSKATNQETFPIRMIGGISLHGAGADKVTILGDQTQKYKGPGHIKADHGIFLPVSRQVQGWDGDRSLLEEVLVEASFVGATGNTTIEGITFRGGDVQVYQEVEAEGRLRVQNCVFDMLDKTPSPNDAFDQLGGPKFGVLSVAVYNDSGTPKYPNSAIQFLNNTVVMSWQPNDNDSATHLVACKDGAVGFCDVNDPAFYPNIPGIVHDPNSRQLRSINNHFLVNNIFRTTGPKSPASRAMIGVDKSDTTVTIGTQLGERNGFASGRADSNTPNNPTLPRYWSFVLPASLPKPVLDINPANAGGRDPAFVGEFINREYGWNGPVTNDRYVRDWRLLPSSACEGLGAAPVNDVIRVANGETYTGTQDLLSAFDYDMEGPGNPRIAAPPRNPNLAGKVDLGADEASNFIQTRCYANSSVAHNDFVAQHNQQYPAGVTTGQATVEMITPRDGSLALDFHWSPIALGYLVDVRWPTLLANPILVNNDVGYSHWHLNGSLADSIVGTVMRNGYLAPYESTGISFGRWTSTPFAAVGQLYMSAQGAFLPPQGAPEPAALTNAQSYHY